MKYQKEGGCCSDKDLKASEISIYEKTEGRQRLTLGGLATEREQWKDVIGKG